MNALRSLRFLCIFAVLYLTQCHAEEAKTDELVLAKPGDKTLEVFEGVTVNIPRDNSSRRLLSFELDTNKTGEEGRGKKKKLLSRILPMFLLPFIIQSTIIPMFLGMLKFMLLKSLLIGKIALVLIIVNAFKNNNSFKGRDAEVASNHYGYLGHGMEFGSYFN